MLIKRIFMELRTRLRSCNVYITTGIDLTKNCNLKISIQANCIVLNHFTNDENCLKKSNSYSSIESLSDCYSEEDSDTTTVIPIDDYCQIIPNSMSGLRIDKNNISFRILTAPKDGSGDFYKEVLSMPTIDTNISNAKLKINIKEKESFKILCSNCSNIISDNMIQFNRILELPTCNLDMSEWFCHNHGNYSENNDNEIVIKPNKNDFMYRLTFFVVNVNGLSEKTNKFNKKREIYHCNRCLAWLGLKSKDSVKLFNSTAKFDQGNGENTIFEAKNHLQDINVNDFIYTIESVIKEFNLGFQFTVMCKMVLECTVNANKKQFLLIWVIDKELEVLQSCENIIEDDKVKLRSNYLTKILYKVEVTQSEEVDVWISDPTVVTTEISKNMFINGIEHLKNTSLIIPECFRSTNGFMVSYLKV